MTDHNVIPIRPGVMQEPSRDQSLNLLHGWQLCDDGHWRPTSGREPEPPFIMAIQRKMEQLAADAARSNYVEGVYRGTRATLPYVALAAVAGFLLGLGVS